VNKIEYLDKVETAVVYLQMHKHMKTCYSRKTGETGCRSGIPYAYVDESGVVRLVLAADDVVMAYENFDMETPDSVAEPMSTIPGLASSLRQVNSKKNIRVPFPKADSRPIGK
jgi:hypothetical protein